MTIVRKPAGSKQPPGFFIGRHACVVMDFMESRKAARSLKTRPTSYLRDLAQ